MKPDDLRQVCKLIGYTPCNLFRIMSNRLKVVDNALDIEYYINKDKNDNVLPIMRQMTILCSVTMKKIGEKRLGMQLRQTIKRVEMN